MLHNVHTARTSLVSVPMQTPIISQQPKTPLSPPFPTSTLWSGPRPPPTTFIDTTLGTDLQLKQLVNENQRKDLLILDLRKQVSELLRYREQCSNLRAQVALVEEREKLREAEANAKNNELIERVRYLEEMETTLRSQNIRLEEEKADFIRKQNQQISDLHAQLAALRADAERRETTRQKLEYELTLSAKSTFAHQQQVQEREKTQQTLIRQFQDQITQLTSEKLELEGRVTNAEAKVHFLQAEARDVQLALEKEVARSNSLENDREAMRNIISTLEEEVTAKRHDSANALSLQQEVQQLVPFKSEAMRLRHALADEEERSKSLENDKKRLVEVSRQLEQQLDEEAQRNMSAIALHSELHDLKTRSEILTHDLDRYRTLSDKLREQISKDHQRLDSYCSELMRALVSAREIVGSKNAKNYGDTGSEMLDNMWLELHVLLASLGSENTSLKDRCNNLKVDLDARLSLLQSKDVVIVDAQKRAEEWEESSKTLSLKTASLESSLHDIQVQNTTLKTELSTYHTNLRNLYVGLDSATSNAQV